MMVGVYLSGRTMSTMPSRTELPGNEFDLDPVGLLVRPVRAAAFWLAIALPLAYLPALAMGFESVSMTVFVGLLIANAVSLVVGHGHNRG